MVLVIKNRKTNSLEDFVKNEKEFDTWLKEYNQERVEEGKKPEKENDFELIDIKKVF